MKVIKLLATLILVCLLLTPTACGKKGPPKALTNVEGRVSLVWNVD